MHKEIKMSMMDPKKPHEYENTLPFIDRAWGYLDNELNNLQLSIMRHHGTLITHEDMEKHLEQFEYKIYGAPIDLAFKLILSVQDGLEDNNHKREIVTAEEILKREEEFENQKELLRLDIIKILAANHPEKISEIIIKIKGEENDTDI